MSRKPIDPRNDPDVPQGMSIDLLKDLHLLTREGQLNADARRKLKQIRHFVGLLRPALDDVYQRHVDPTIVDCGAGKSYLGFLLYELVIGPATRGRLVSVESRPELVEGAASRASRFGHARFRFEKTDIASASTAPPLAQTHIVTALHACDTATDDALALGIRSGADYIAVVPCCQAEIARQLAERPGEERLGAETSGDGAAPDGDESPETGRAGEQDLALIRHPLHRREFGSHLTNVIRGLCLEARGYKVTVTELVGWEHSLKNELILAKRVRRENRQAQATLAGLLTRWNVRPSLVQQLEASGPLR